MPRNVAFLRGINLGNRRLKMAELRDGLEGLGLENVATFLASGNVVFDHPASDVQELGELEDRIERRFEEALGFRTDTFVRPLSRLAELVERVTAAVGGEEGVKPHVIFLERRPDGAVEEELAALETPDDRFPVLGREVVWLRRGGLTDSSIETRDLEKALGGMENTMRNLNTVRRIVEKFGS